MRASGRRDVRERRTVIRAHRAFGPGCDRSLMLVIWTEQIRMFLSFSPNGRTKRQRQRPTGGDGGIHSTARRGGLGKIMLAEMGRRRPRVIGGRARAQLVRLSTSPAHALDKTRIHEDNSGNRNLQGGLPCLSWILRIR